MSNSIPKRNLPLRVVLHRVGEATLSQYKAANILMDTPQAAFEMWREVVMEDPGHEPDKEHLVVVLLNTKMRMIGYHVVSVGSLNEAIAHPEKSSVRRLWPVPTASSSCTITRQVTQHRVGPTSG